MKTISLNSKIIKQLTTIKQGKKTNEYGHGNYFP